MRLVKPGFGAFARPREASGPSYYRLTADLLAASTVLIAGGALVAALSSVSVVGRPGGSLPAPAAAPVPPLIAAPAASPSPAVPATLRLRLRTASSSDPWAEFQDSQAPSAAAAWGAAVVWAPGDQRPGDPIVSQRSPERTAIPQLDYGTATSAPTADALELGSWQAQFLDSAGLVVGGPEESVQGLPVPGPRHVTGPLPAADVTVRELRRPAYELGGPGQQKPGFRLMCDACLGLRWVEHWLTQSPAKPAYTTTEAVLLDMALIYVNHGGTVNLAEWNF